MAPPSQSSEKANGRQQAVLGDQGEELLPAPAMQERGDTLIEDNPTQNSNKNSNRTGSEGNPIDLRSPPSDLALQYFDNPYLDPSAYVRDPSCNSAARVQAPHQTAAYNRPGGIQSLPAMLQYNSGSSYRDVHVGLPAPQLPPRHDAQGDSRDAYVPLGHPNSRTQTSQGVPSQQRGQLSVDNGREDASNVFHDAHRTRRIATPANVGKANHSQQANIPANASTNAPGSEGTWKWYQENFGSISSQRLPKIQISTFPPYNTSIEHSVSLNGICQDFPNHLGNDDVLDALIQYFYTDADIYNRLRDEYKNAVIQKIQGFSHQTKNVYMKRLESRWKKLGLENLRKLIEGPKLRVSEPRVGVEPYFGRSEPGRMFKTALNRGAQPKPPREPESSKDSEDRGSKTTRKSKTQPKPAAPGMSFTMEAVLSREFRPIPYAGFPCGSFCDLPFWTSTDQFQQLEMSFMTQIEEVFCLADNLAEADPARSVGVLPRFRELLDSMELPVILKDDIMRQPQLEDTIGGQDLHAVYTKILAFLLADIVCANIVDGAKVHPYRLADCSDDPLFMESQRAAALVGVQVKIQGLVKVVQEKYQALIEKLEKSLALLRPGLSGQKRSLAEPEADGSNLKKQARSDHGPGQTQTNQSVRTTSVAEPVAVSFSRAQIKLSDLHIPPFRRVTRASSA